NFLNAIFELGQTRGWFSRKLHSSGGRELSKNPAKVIDDQTGDIRDKNIHESSVIVNVANTQAQFRGGISGAIAKQVGNKDKINQKFQGLISKFNQGLGQTKNRPGLFHRVMLIAGGGPISELDETIGCYVPAHHLFSSDLTE